MGSIIIGVAGHGRRSAILDHRERMLGAMARCVAAGREGSQSGDDRRFCVPHAVLGTAGHDASKKSGLSGCGGSELPTLAVLPQGDYKGGAGAAR